MFGLIRFGLLHGRCLNHLDGFTFNMSVEVKKIGASPTRMRIIPTGHGAILGAGAVFDNVVVGRLRKTIGVPHRRHQRAAVENRRPVSSAKNRGTQGPTVVVIVSFERRIAGWAEPYFIGRAIRFKILRQTILISKVTVIRVPQHQRGGQMRTVIVMI